MSFSNRHSIYSTTSGTGFQSASNQQHGPLTTSSLLAALHNAHQTRSPYALDSTTSVVVNSGAGQAVEAFVGVLDEELGMRAWEHARRRAEDQTILLTSTSSPAPSLLPQMLASIPSAPDILNISLNLVHAFTSCVTPASPFSVPRHNGLGVSVQLSLAGNIIGAQIALSDAGVDATNGLLHIPAKEGYRAFDVFYYLLSAVSTPAEREGLGLESPEKYTLLARSNTYTLPDYLPTADDSAAAEDWRSNLRAVGIKGSTLRGLLSVLAGILKLGNAVGLLVDEEVVEDVAEDVAELLGLEPEVLAKNIGDDERELFIGTVYGLVVEWIIGKANDAIAADFAVRKEMDSNSDSSQDGDTVQINVLEIPNNAMSKAICLKSVFEDDSGLNSEMKADGVNMPSVTSSVSREVKSAWSEAERSGLVGLGREREYENDRKEQIIEKVGREIEDDGFLRPIIFPAEHGRPAQHTRIDVTQLLASSRVWYHLNLSPIDDATSGANQHQAWAAATVSSQLRSWRLPEWANRRTKKLDFTADFDFDEFALRYGPLGCSGGRDGVESWILERGWSNGEVVVGMDRVWMCEGPWWEAENMLDIKQPGVMPAMMGLGAGPMDTSYTMNTVGSSYFPQGVQTAQGSRDQPQSGSNAHLLGSQDHTDQKYGAEQYSGVVDPEIGEPHKIEEHATTGSRKFWAGFVWAVTFWIPSFLLKYVGRMKRPDVRMAWREKVVLVFLIFLANAAIIFWIVIFARLLCPNIDKAWTRDQVKTHQGEEDFWVSIHGNVYDLTDFWRRQHSDIDQESTREDMLTYAGRDLSLNFPAPLYLGCPDLIDDTVLANKQMVLQPNNTDDVSAGDFVHTSGPLTLDRRSALASENWYSERFLPSIKEFWTGDLVWKLEDIRKQGKDINRRWFTINDKVYDLTDYFFTAKGKVAAAGAADYNYLNKDLEEMANNNPGGDITKLFTEKLSAKEQKQNLRCLDNIFYIGIVDFTKSARCQASGYVLLGAAAMMASVILVKFLAALQLGTKRRPAMQDKFVICQVPAYTEGEDSLRKALDSLTALNYDNKRKLICVICDGMVVGGGNDRPTPSIVLEILGVDPKVDPPALPFKSVGDGSQQLNYGKVYSGLYEYEGCVVPYLVVVKVGRPSEHGKSKPGNRGKRDSQILLLEFLNRVHHRTPMSPLQLEMFHQINNIIGVDPELYEYLLMVDADTSVKEDSLNRLVAACAHDSKIAGICGETSLENEERSWWTMIQVYEYYISHNLSKAFESLFGSVTCLPGCFSMYRLRTADKGRPLIVSTQIVEEYSDGIVDTLHKKNLLSLGEDRYLTTLMTKHFPTMSYKFIPDAYAMTAAPETWSILLSQRRRWINSTIHNLAELIWLEDMCGFCCFSMRFVVLLDLVGTIILPATCIYIGYLIYVIATNSGPFPYLSLGMIAGVYGLQALIFIIKRKWQHVGWMIIYILAFPIYSFILPIYSFWAQDDFSWGNTRVVIGESSGKKIVATTDEETFDPKSIPLQPWDEYATRHNLPGRRGGAGEKYGGQGYEDNGYEMDDMHSVYSSAKPASTIMTGFPNMAGPPHSPAPFNNRNSSYSAYTNSGGHDQGQQQRLMSMGGISSGDYWQDGNPNRRSMPLSVGPSSDNLLGRNTPPPRAPSRSPLGFAGSRPASQMDFTRVGGGPDDESIIDAIRSVLREIDLETVTKKQVRALVEQRLQTECQGERRSFLDNQIDLELSNM